MKVFQICALVAVGLVLAQAGKQSDKFRKFAAAKAGNFTGIPVIAPEVANVTVPVSRVSAQTQLCIPSNFFWIITISLAPHLKGAMTEVKDAEGNSRFCIPVAMEISMPKSSPETVAEVSVSYETATQVLFKSMLFAHPTTDATAPTVIPSFADITRLKHPGTGAHGSRCAVFKNSYEASAGIHMGETLSALFSAFLAQHDGKAPVEAFINQHTGAADWVSGEFLDLKPDFLDACDSAKATAADTVVFVHSSTAAKDSKKKSLTPVLEYSDLRLAFTAANQALESALGVLSDDVSLSMAEVPEDLITFLTGICLVSDPICVPLATCWLTPNLSCHSWSGADHDESNHPHGRGTMHSYRHTSPRTSRVRPRTRR